MSDLLNKLQSLIGKGSTESTTESSGTKNASSSTSSYNEVSVFSNQTGTASSSSTTQMNDEEYLWWEERLEEKKAVEEQAELGYDTPDVEPQTGEKKALESKLKETKETATEDSFDINNLDPKEWSSIEPQANGFMAQSFGQKGYTYKTSSGMEISLDDIKDVKILENKQTGEVVVIGANGAKITGSGKNAILSIYDSNIDEINTGKGSDNIKITSSKVNEINTGNGTDSIVITGDSHVKKMNTGAGSDSVSIIDSNVSDTNTNSKFMWGLFDDKEDTVIIDNSYAGKINTGKGNDNVIISNSAVDTIKSGKGDDNLSINNTKVNELNTNETDKIVEDGNYLDIDIQKISDIDALDSVTLPDGSCLRLDDYLDSLLNQPTSFETEEEYQAYVIETLTSNLETMRNVFGAQEDRDGWVANSYNDLKEFFGLGISDKDVEAMISDQETMIKALTDAMNGKGNMSFEEAYELYTGTSYSKEKLDNYLEASNVYSAMMVGLQYDPNYLEKFEAATGMSVEDVTKEYAMCQLDTFGKSTGFQDLIEKYSQDQEGFTDKLSSALTSLGFGCTIVGAALSFVFPPAGMLLLSTGKAVTLGGMFIDNVLDLADDSTDKDGLTKEEFKENAIETGIEAASYLSGRLIGGGLKGLKLSGINEAGALSKFINSGTNGLNDLVTSKMLGNGISELGAKVIGQAAETGTDMFLSLGADYMITQGQSILETGQFVAWDDYWSLDRFLGEGKSQLIGILTGISSSKVSAYQQGVMATAGAKINAGDIDGAKSFLKKSGMKMNDTNFEQFVKTVQDANTEVKLTQPLPEIEDTELLALKSGNNETELPKQNSNNQDTEVIKAETDTKTPNTEPLKESGSDVEVDKSTETEISTTKQLNIEQLKTLTKEEQIQALKSNGVSDFKIEQLMELGSEAVAKVISLTNKGTNIYNAKNIAELGDIEYQRAIELIDKYYLGSDGSVNLKEIVSLNNDAYSKVPELLASNCHTDCIAKIASLYDPTYPDDYETAIKLLNDGYDSFSIANCIDDCGFIDTSKLTNADLVKQPRNIDIDYSNIDATKQILVDKINTLYKSDVVSIDSDTSTIAQKWKSKYIDGGANPLSLDNQTNNFMIENSCQKYENPTGEPMARWMEISNLSYFINNFPATGEIYTFDRMQSFAKTEAGAETIRGNNFSDTNTSKNVKILVIPNEKTTQAYDVGNGKYGSDEVLYKAGTQFKVVSQGFEEIKLPSGEINKQYVVRLEEIPVQDADTTKLQNNNVKPSGELAPISKTTVNVDLQKKIDIKTNEIKAKSTTITIKEFTMTDGSKATFECYEGFTEGTNGGYWVKNTETGELFFAKPGNQQSQAEVLASKLYEMAGINVAEMSLCTMPDGQVGLLSKFIPDIKPYHGAGSKHNDAFGMDALLANWDAVCSDNTVTDGTNVYRLDLGSTFDFRAQGQQKSFSGNVYEVSTLLDSNVNLTSSTYFSRMTPETMIDSIKKVTNLDNAEITKLLKDSGMEKYTDVLLERKNFLEEFVKIAENTSKASNERMANYTKRIYSEVVNKINATKFADTEIPDVTVNQRLSSNAVALNQTFQKHIAEVKTETKERFSGLETVEDKNITARAKGDDSTFSKLASKFKSGKLTSTDIDACSNVIGDAYGTRIQMNSVEPEVAKAEITKALDGTDITYEQFINHITGKVEYDDATKQKIDKIKTPVLDTLKTKQSQEVVNRLVELIKNSPEGDPEVITELNNYGGTVSSYFTDAQLEQIATAYSERYGKPLDIVTKLDETNHPSGKLEVTRKDGKKILNVESSKAKYTDKGAIKDAGYTSSQMNTKHKLSDGTIGNGELQIRGTEVNAFADVEHIPYDIKQGKVNPDDPKYSSIYKLIDGMSEKTYKAYNEYLTAVYDSLRLKELGIPVEGEPDIKTYLKDSGLSDDDMILLSRKGLEKLH